MKKYIPDKLYFKIGEVAKLAEVPTHVLRYWESEFSEIRPKRAGSGQRLYRKKDIVFILQIKTLLHEHGYTIAGARKFLAAGNKKPPPAQGNETTGRKIPDQLSSIKQELLELQNILLSKKE
ncbi:transcriptional regulator [Desulfomarina profundi]|uniref:Transcriptional regulator n=1 Tax=Desulfomarina profundi TaxID=2772557 RepID=A0A8D5JQW4_9BACT|nr:MerR family transcriptional regulator [Desulfomarina profundi]BCL60456.1 transcriptional regulator [Desulfomarina profundi]